ncbi:MAG: hypothetical protein KDA53_13245 [Hyphomonas sp.]|nr:hypothetical protein [Hyphomonas sp.]
MRHLILMAALPFGLLACGSGEPPGPEGTGAEYQDALSIPEPLSPAMTYPAGTWYDGYGGSWQVTVDDAALTALWTGPADGLYTMKGSIDGANLAYEVRGPEDVVFAMGMAILTDADHASFATYGADGTMSLTGQLHFNHLPGQPGIKVAEAAPVPPCEPLPETTDINFEQPEEEASDGVQ